nr:histone-lysine N-methyltransferase, H3 lysine-9 specific SUVH4-like isoform X1 [Tanacetum cinerariifolium]
MAGCKCKGGCTKSKNYTCAKLNGGEFPYVQDSGGILIEAKDVLFECGPNCGCGPGCINRVFQTSDRGWAVKTNDCIPFGAPICEYIEQLRRQCEMDKVGNNEYMFEIDYEQTIKEIRGREAGSVGNVARFINHSCDPNLFFQYVVSSHHDLRLARIILVASDNIPPNQELTYDYRLVSVDITGGQEELPIPVINTINDTTITGLTFPPTVAGCKCKRGCTNSKTCACGKLNGSDFPYVQDSGGRFFILLIEGGLSRPICKYIRQLRRQCEMDKVDNNEYIFEIDCEQTIKEIEGRERRMGAVSGKSKNLAVDEKESKKKVYPLS